MHPNTACTMQYPNQTHTAYCILEHYSFLSNSFFQVSVNQKTCLSTSLISLGEISPEEEIWVSDKYQAVSWDIVKTSKTNGDSSIVDIK